MIGFNLKSLTEQRLRFYVNVIHNVCLSLRSFYRFAIKCASYSQVFALDPCSCSCSVFGTGIQGNTFAICRQNQESSLYSLFLSLFLSLSLSLSLKGQRLRMSYCNHFPSGARLSTQLHSSLTHRRFSSHFIWSILLLKGNWNIVQKGKAIDQDGRHALIW